MGPDQTRTTARSGARSEEHTQYETAGALSALQLLQERKNLEAELATLSSDDGVDLDRLRKAFVKNAKAYGAAKGIAYGTWREIGVPADVLRDAGISRSS